MTNPVLRTQCKASKKVSKELLEDEEVNTYVKQDFPMPTENKLITLEDLVPGAGSSSYLVTIGPNVTFIISPLIP